MHQQITNDMSAAAIALSLREIRPKIDGWKINFSIRSVPICFARHKAHQCKKCIEQVSTQEKEEEEV